MSDVGAHKIWVARLFPTYEPNTVIISNGFAAMGISLPGAIAASLVHPDRRVVALCGDGAFLMNSQELETARRIGARICVVIWRDDGYGLIDWKQRDEFGRPFGVSFGNPDFVAYAESFGIPAFRPSSAADLFRRSARALDVRGAVARRRADRLPREPATHGAAGRPRRRSRGSAEARPMDAGRRRRVGARNAGRVGAERRPSRRRDWAEPALRDDPVVKSRGWGPTLMSRRHGLRPWISRPRTRRASMSARRGSKPE